MKVRTMRGKNYARLRVWDGSKEHEQLIPLDTTPDDEKETLSRFLKVKEVLPQLKNGTIQKFQWEEYFPWLNSRGTSKLINKTLKDIIPEYLKHLHRYGAVRDTISRRRDCLNNLIKTLGSKFPVESLNRSSIDKFIDQHRGRLTDIGVNMHLAHIRALTNWLYDEKEILPKRIKVKMLKVDIKEPVYLTQHNIEYILSLTEIDEHCKLAFQFYWETGLRLREPYLGTIKNGQWLIIPKTKNRKGKRIELLPHHIPIWNAMMDRFNKSKARYRSKSGYYSRVFKKAVRLIGRGELHFHNLRDTFAIIRYIQTRNIYDVSKELHHSSVGVTEKYANYYSMKELLSDWDCLVDNENNLPGESASDSDTVLSPHTGVKIPIRDTVIRETQDGFIMGNA